MAAGDAEAPGGLVRGGRPGGRLPQVSWLVAPTAQSEHPDYFPAAGAEYIASKLDAIASNDDLWPKTLFILTYDENDGLFDHVPPPVAPRGTRGEYVAGEPIGLGFRVPAIVVSPWSAGGRVCSDVLDHTSLIRLIERRFGSGSRTSAPPPPHLRRLYRRPALLRRARRLPAVAAAITLAAAEAGLLTAQREVCANPAPLVPVTNRPVPRQ